MSFESQVNLEPTPQAGEFTASPEEWAQIGERFEEILVGPEGRAISQRTWNPHLVYQPEFEYTVNYEGTTMILKRIGQTEPNLDTCYTMECINQKLNFKFSVRPYLNQPKAVLEGDQPRLVAPDKLSESRLGLLREYLNTHRGEANG